MSLLKDALPMQHVGYLVKDRDACVAHLEKLYGITGWKMVEYKPMATKCYGEPFENYYVKAAVHPPIDGCGIELIQPVSGGLHYDFKERDHDSINHICHKPADYEYWINRFVEKGCELVFEAEMEDDVLGYRRCGYVYDPVLRTVFEFAEIPHFRNKK